MNYLLVETDSIELLGAKQVLPINKMNAALTKNGNFICYIYSYLWRNYNDKKWVFSSKYR